MAADSGMDIQKGAIGIEHGGLGGEHRRDPSFRAAMLDAGPRRWQAARRDGRRSA
jgi:hypothetical protein